MRSAHVQQPSTSCAPSLSVSFTNIRSLLPKRVLLDAYLDDSKSDVLLLTETWLHADVCDTELYHASNQYSIYRHDRAHKKGGGVLFAIKRSIPSFLVDTNTPLDIVWVACPTLPGKLLMGVCYRPPSSDRLFVSELHKSIARALDLFPTRKIYLFGDFNFPDINWSLMSSSSSASSEFIELCYDFNFTQLVSQPTRDTNILDLILTTEPHTIGPVVQLDGFSDHNLLQFSINIPLKFPGVQRKVIRDYSKANYDQMNAELDVFLHDTFLPSFTKRSVQENWNSFKNIMALLIDKYVPLITISNDKSNPWFNKSLRSLRNKKKRLYASAKRSSSTKSWSTYKDCLKSYSLAISEAKKKYFSADLSSLLHTNPKKFWRAISPDRGSDIVSLHNADNIPVSASECASTFNSFFCSVFTNEDFSSVPCVSDLEYCFMSPISVTAEGICKLIHGLKVSTSCGVDNINSKVLRNTSASSSQILCHIFQQSLSTGQLPTDWKIAKVIPIFKDGNKHSPGNYRPISLTCICCKLLEHIVTSHIYSHLESNKFFFVNQHGFRKAFSCDTQLLEFTSDLHNGMNNNKIIDCIFLDYAKAFDRVAHCRLIAKLSALRLDSSTLSWLRNFLSNRQQFTFVNNFSSSTSFVSSGVPQGSVLGPLLFLIYINDLPFNISSSIRLFADDCVVYRTINCEEDHVSLQKDLDLINQWCDRWQMTLNTSKCCVLSFTRRKSVFNFPYSICSAEIPRSSTYKYLGVHLCTNLAWCAHIEKICMKANRTLGFLRRNLHHSPSTIRQQAYQTFVRPQLEYASSIWSPHQQYLIDKLESIQNRAARFITSKYSRHSSISQIKRDISLTNLDSRRSVTRLCLLHKYYYNSWTSRLSLDIPSRTSSRLHNHLSFKRIFGHTQAFNNSALPRAIALWNSLPTDIVTLTDPAKFRERLQVYMFP